MGHGKSFLPANFNWPHSRLQYIGRQSSSTDKLLFLLQELFSLSSGYHFQELSLIKCLQFCILWYSCPFMCLKMHSLISSGLAYKLRSGALWRRRHSGVQNDENASRSATAQGHESHAGHEGTYHPALRAIITHHTSSATPSHVHL